jgi:hypothetical protein
MIPITPVAPPVYRPPTQPRRVEPVAPTPKTPDPTKRNNP